MVGGTSKEVSRLEGTRRDKFSGPLRHYSPPAERVKANESLTKGQCQGSPSTLTTSQLHCFSVPQNYTQPPEPIAACFLSLGNGRKDS